MNLNIALVKLFQLGLKSPISHVESFVSLSLCTEVPSIMFDSDDSGALRVIEDLVKVTVARDAFWNFSQLLAP